MKKLPKDFPKVRPYTKKGRQYWHVDSRNVHYPIGKLESCGTEEEARKKAKNIRETIENLVLDDTASFIVNEARRILDDDKVSLIECVKFYKKHHQHGSEKLSVSEMCKRFIKYKKSGEDRKLRPRSLEEIDFICGKFKDGNGGEKSRRLVAAVEKRGTLS